MPAIVAVCAPEHQFARRIRNLSLLALFLMTGCLLTWGQITVSPTSLSFASTVVGNTSAGKGVTISNNGASAQAVVIAPSGDYTETDNCAGSIAASGNCTMNVFFAPTVAGTITGAVTIRDGGGNLLAFVGTTGKAIAQVTTTPTSLSFGSVAIGTTSATKTLKITSNITGPVQIQSITPSADYSVPNTGTCLTTPLNKGQSCTVTVAVTPEQATDNGAIIITDNDANASPLIVGATASGSGTVTTPLTLSKLSLTFKAFKGGTSAAQSVTLSNNSGSAVTMGTITASGQYSQTNTCPAAGSPLNNGSSCSIAITFSPTVVGKVGGSVAIAYTGSDSPQIINLSGTASDILSVTTKVAFGNVNLGTTSAAKPVAVTNNSTSVVTLNSIVASGDFLIQGTGTTCPLTGGSLGAGKKCTVETQFAPTVTGAVLGALTITNSASPNPLLVSLTGSGVNTASATLNPSSAHQGTSETIAITGTGTNFGPSTTVNFGANITTGTLTVNGPTSASVPITIDNTAATGARNVTITTGSQVVTASFTVIAGVPAITLINPNTIQPTQTESVSVTGAFTNWGSTTKANFGPGISVGGAAAGTFGPVTVNNATSLTASLKTSGAALGLRTVQVQTGTQTLTVENGMDVVTCPGSAPTVLLSNPAYGLTNVPLNAQPQFQFSQPMNRSTFALGSTNSVYFFDATTSGGEVPGTISLDASGTIATITPSLSLAAGHFYYTYLSYATPVQDTCGNNLSGQTFYYFQTAFSPNLTGPSLTGNSPENNDTNIPLNAPVVLQFSNPIDPITAQLGVTLTTGGNSVAGNFTYSSDDKTVTFTPPSPLTASTSYTVTYSAAVTDQAGNALTNPGSFSFTTGTSSDTANPQVVLVNPPSQTFGVGLNVVPRLTFNKPINQLTIPKALALYYENGSLVTPGTVAVSADRMSATITPSAALLPNTEYGVYICGYTDIAGNNGSCFNSSFWTATSGDTGHATVSSISPSNGQTGVPLNTLVSVVMNDDIDATTISNSSITVTPSGGSAVAGAVSLASDGVTLTFAPSAALAASTVYNVAVSGFKDVEGNTVTSFSSSFTTGTVGYGNGTFSVSSTNPLNGATGVSVTSPVKFTMTNLINASSVNSNSVEVYILNTSTLLAGSYSVNGSVVTFTPLTAYPGNTQIGMYINGLTDEAGNPAFQNMGSFTTANTSDTTTPTVTISPANGATNVGLNTQIVLTFSKSMNPSTITANTLALFNGDQSINYGDSISRDNRTVVLNNVGGQFASGATITVALNSGIQDLSGNALQPTSSTFTVTTALSGANPYVTVMRPGNGSTDVPGNTLVTLFTSAAMNPGTITGALHVVDNGVVVSGSVQMFSNGQAIQFTPGAPFGAGHVVQVFLDSTAQSATGVALQSFSGQFTVQGSPTNTAALPVTMNPFPGATGVPLNTVLQVEYDQPLNSSSIACSGSSGPVTVYQYSTGTYLNPSCTLSGTQVINIAPTSNLLASSPYQVCVSGGGVTNVDGVPVQTFCFSFTAGSAADTVAPAITSEAPTNNSTNIGTNTIASVNFNKAINPVSVTGSTIQLSAGSTNETASSISFTPDYKRVSITPQAPLPPSTQMTVAISGVTSQAGKAVANTTTHFTTGAGPDFTQAVVINSSVLANQANVPVNSVFTMQFSKAMDIGSFVSTNTYVYDFSTGTYISTTVSWSTDQTTVFLVPNSALRVGSLYQLGSFSLLDLTGNQQQGFAVDFTTAFAANTNPPTVINTSPENTEGQVPTNSPVEVLFSEPIQPTSITGVTLTQGANTIATTPSFSNANQLLTLTPGTLLTPNTTYTITITGVKDTAGNTMTGTVTNTFTTGATFDVVPPHATTWDPAQNSLGVGTNIAPKIVFSERLNPLSVNTNSFQLYEYYTGLRVALTTSISADRLTATMTPTAPLQPNTTYYTFIGCATPYYDVAGNAGQCLESVFITANGADTVHTTVSTISPSNAQTGAPLNAQITALMSDDIDPTSVTNNSITVTPQGGSAIAGTVTLAPDGATLTFIPSAALNPSTIYNVSIGGFVDTEGNTVTTFTSSFTTGTVSFGGGTFGVVSTNPVNGATGVSVTSPVTFTMTNLIDPASVNSNTVLVYINSTSASIAGSYAVSGSTVTFTPQTHYPASTQIGMFVNGLSDEAGNTAFQGLGTFTTTTTTDTTPPTLTISPANGTSNVGQNTQVVLTFSKSINPTTINSTSVNLLNGDTPINPSFSISKDNRTVILNSGAGPLPAGATITVTATHLVQDLSGNALADTTSQFTVTPPATNAAPYVISMRPGNGATDVPTNSVITLFTSAPMNQSSLSSALHVSQNGVLISGSTNVGSNGQSIEFTPTSALTAGTITQVFLDSTAQDINGNNLQYFSGQFTTAGSPTNTASQPVTSNPFPGATNVPLNTVMQLEYDQPLQSASISCNGNSGSVSLYQYSSGTYLNPNCTLVGSGQVINIAPTSNLVANSQYQLCVSTAVTNVDGVPVQNYCISFVAGTATDTVAPAITAIAPPDTATNIGTNAGVSVTFNKAINPASVSGSSIQLSAGATIEVPSSISFSNNYTRVSIIPQAQLPSSTQMTITINGVTSQAGVAVASRTTHFTTMPGPDFIAPSVVHASVDSNQTVGTNAAFAMQFSEPMDTGSFNPTSVYLYDFNLANYVTTTASFSTDQTTVMLKPTSNLTANHQLQLCSFSMVDLAGNQQGGFCVDFFSGSGSDTTGPLVQQVSPPAAATAVPTNSVVAILFNEPISGASLAGVQLTAGSTPVPTSATLYDGDMGVQLTPLTPLSPGTVYTINVAGVVDITGNTQSSFTPTTFTTGTGTDLVPPTVTSTTPTNGQTGVAVTTSMQVVFSKAMDPASFDVNNSFTLRDPSNTVVPATVTFSSNFKTVTLKPKASLNSATTYTMYIGYFSVLKDWAGNNLSATITGFTTQ